MPSVDDIEDLFAAGDDLSTERTGIRQNVVPRVRKKKHPLDEMPQGDSIIPGTQRIYVKTWGCSHNSSDGEYMAGQLAAYGYKITEDKSVADLWLLNSCTVKSPAEDHFRNEITAAHGQGKKVVVAGCVPQGAPKANYLQGLSMIGVQQIDRVVEVVEETLKGHSVQLLKTKKESGKKIGGADLSLPKIRKNPLIEIIAINTGCLNQCTYCKTKHARGELGSYPPEEIVARAKQSFQEGCVELWLTSEDTGAYGHDIGVTLPQLLWQLVDVIPEGAMLRLGMTNPPYILEHLEEMAKIMSHPRVYSFLHVPVQSASDSVLMDMRREYCLQLLEICDFFGSSRIVMSPQGDDSDKKLAIDFKHVVDFLKERVPDITIATDFICGFPTETEKDFDESLRLVDEYKFPSLFINQFFPRPGTPAARMQRIPPPTVKHRTKRMSELFLSYRTYDHKVGQVQRVLVTEISHDKKYYVAHNKSYDQVLVPMNTELMGKMFDVEIVETGKHYLKGRLLTGTDVRRPEKVPPPLERGQVSGLASSAEDYSQTGYLWWIMAVIAVAFVARIAYVILSKG